jgi:hypothetical protein
VKARSAPMSTDLTRPRPVRCPDCGCATTPGPHECDPEQLVDHQVLRLRDDIDRFERDFGAYLESGAGGIAQWLAERTRPAFD